ncbi:hypothetical protein F4805DRAFT_476273 [Annulohypoxylon moriforme]|nr:hypothetical protein F4805DRAFT_476273 [Annulohypoxylon moriforme]
MSTESEPLSPEQEATLHETRGPDVIATVSLFIGLTTVAVALRFASRISRRARIGVDDWLSVAALIVLIGFSVLVILAVHRGMGFHDWAISDDQWWRIIQVEWICAFVNGLVRGLVKMTLLFFYRRVFTMNVKWFKYTWYALFCYIIGHTLAVVFSAVFECAPPSYAWEEININLDPPAQGHCKIDDFALTTASGALTIAVEVALFILPITMLSQLHLKYPQKIGLMLIFGTGILAIGAECARVGLEVSSYYPNTDANWTVADIYLWTVVEDSVGLICACLPTFGPVILTTKNVLSSYISGISSLRSVKSSSVAWPGQPSPRCDSAGGGDFDRKAVKTSTPTLNSDQPSYRSQQGILRIDEYNLDTCLRTDELPLHNYHDPTKPTGNGSVV